MQLYIIDESEIEGFSNLIRKEAGIEISRTVEADKLEKRFKLSMGDKIQGIKNLLLVSTYKDPNTSDTKYYLVVLKSSTDIRAYLSGHEAVKSNHDIKEWLAVDPVFLARYEAKLQPYKIADMRSLFPKAPEPGKTPAATPAPSKPGTPVSSAHNGTGGVGQRGPSFTQAMNRSGSLVTPVAELPSAATSSSATATADSTTSSQVSTMPPPKSNQPDTVIDVNALLDGITTAPSTSSKKAATEDDEPKTPVLNLSHVGNNANMSAAPDANRTAAAAPRLSQMRGNVVSQQQPSAAAARNDDASQPLLPKKSLSRQGSVTKANTEVIMVPAGSDSGGCCCVIQ